MPPVNHTSAFWRTDTVAAVFTCNAEAIDRLDPFRGDGPTQTISSVQATRAAAAKAWNTDAAKTHPPADNLTVDQARQIAVTSRDLASDNGGSSPGRRWASNVLPTPGGPVIIR